MRVGTPALKSLEASLWLPRTIDLSAVAPLNTGFAPTSEFCFLRCWSDMRLKFWIDFITVIRFASAS